MKAKLIINDKELEVEISEKELKKIENKFKKTGYERVDDNQVFWYDAGGETGSDYDIHGDGEIKQMYEVANYYSDFNVAYNNGRADKLMRRLRRFAVENRDWELDWNDFGQWKYLICYDYATGEPKIYEDNDVRQFGGVYFSSEEAGTLAIDTFRDELIWYFTEYKDSL